MKRPRIADLFCGAGGAGMGLHRAGFEVVGFDIAPQKHYPFEFHQENALTVDLSSFDAIWASPPCQAYTSMRAFGKGAGVGAPDLIPDTRVLLEASMLPWLIENVPGAPLRIPYRLCGSSFNLGVRRHRLFETNRRFEIPGCRHGGRLRPIAVYGDHPQGSQEHTYRVNRARSLTEGQVAMGIDWMTWKELTQAVPPAYSEYLGRQLRNALVWRS